jgi:DNA polymerase (family 10)
MNSEKGKFNRDEASFLATALATGIEVNQGATVTICGSIRRGQNVIGDIDLAVACPITLAVDAVQKISSTLKVQCEVLSKTTNGVTCTLLVDNIQINMYHAREEFWGAMILFLTGSKLFNILMRSEAKNQGYKLNQYGLWHGEECLAGRTEEQIFQALGLPYHSPEERDIKGYDQKLKRS